MKYLEPEFIERSVLPLVVAFGLGVLATGIARDYREDHAVVLAEKASQVADDANKVAGEAIAVAQAYREAWLACGAPLVIAEAQP